MEDMVGPDLFEEQVDRGGQADVQLLSADAGQGEGFAKVSPPDFMPLLYGLQGQVAAQKTGGPCD